MTLDSELVCNPMETSSTFLFNPSESLISPSVYTIVLDVTLHYSHISHIDPDPSPPPPILSEGLTVPSTPREESSLREPTGESSKGVKWYRRRGTWE